MYTTLISAAQLQALLNKPSKPVMVFDCSFDLMNPEAGRVAYDTAHIPSARYVHLDHDLAAKGSPDAASGGRHPLPSRERFAAWLTSIGFTNDTQAVVYDRNNTMIAGRMWWMLKWVGHDAVAVLDGGYAAWQRSEKKLGSDPNWLDKRSADKQLEESRSFADPHSFALSNSLVNWVDASHVASQINLSPILDARAGPRYRGEVEPLDPVAGHIPSALNRPFTENFNTDGTFKDSQQLKAEFTSLLGQQASETINHCGSGVSAIPNILAMQIAGLGTTSLYAGSWSDWCSDAARPVAKG